MRLALLWVLEHGTDTRLWEGQVADAGGGDTGGASVSAALNGHRDVGWHIGVFPAVLELVDESLLVDLPT